jgi:hypothetical protein
MNDRNPRQLELFSDGARAVAAARRAKPPPLKEADLQAKLDAARVRLHEIVILRMKTWLPAETLKDLQWAERSHGSRSDALPHPGAQTRVAVLAVTRLEARV